MSTPRKKLVTRKPAPTLRSRWHDWYVGKGPIFGFVLKFGLLIVLLYALLATAFFDRMLYSYLEANAWFSHLILNLFGENTQVTDVTIHSPRFSIAIRRGCDAVEPTWLFCAAVLSFRGAIRYKILGMLVGVILLQLLNFVRIISLYWIGIHFCGFFNSAHLEIWPTAFIIVAIVLFIGWVEWSSKIPALNPPHAVE